MTEEDEIVVELGFDPPGRLVEASIDYHALIEGSWRSIIRYDNAHGFPHVHRSWTARPAHPVPIDTTPTGLLTIASKDLLAHWHIYRARMEAQE